jgi:tetrahydrodipicolinate N-succinyltransferase
MRIESSSYTAADLRKFLDEMLDHERMALADRLEKASERLAPLAPRVMPGHGDQAWSAHEVLAHIAVLSKFYGVLFHKIASGKMTELELLSNVNLRDVMDEQMAKVDPAELLRMVLEDHSRTIKALRAADAASLRREAKVDGQDVISAEQMVRLPLISHLELHIDQLERALD